MPDLWSHVAELDLTIQERLADVLETRGADPQQQAMRRAMLGDVEFPAGARVLELGCGTGVLTRLLGRWPGVATVVGVDVSADLSHAQVRISVMDDSERADTMEALERARGFLRRRVAQELRHMRSVPELHLHLDTSLDYSMHIDEVLRRAADEREEAERQAAQQRDISPDADNSV